MCCLDADRPAFKDEKPSPLLKPVRQFDPQGANRTGRRDFLRSTSRHRANRLAGFVTAVGRNIPHKAIELFLKPGYMQTKTDQIRVAWLAGDQIGALRIAAQFFDRSNETMIFKRGMDAYNHAQFYRQIGKEPYELVKAALALLQKRFDLICADRQPIPEPSGLSSPIF
jgi:hypothetical protein